MKINGIKFESDIHDITSQAVLYKLLPKVFAPRSFLRSCDWVAPQNQALLANSRDY